MTASNIIRSNVAIQTNIIRSTVAIQTLTIGDTVEIDGELFTVSKNDLKYDAFMGHSFRGQLFRKGITKIVFKVPVVGGFRYQ